MEGYAAEFSIRMHRRLLRHRLLITGASAEFVAYPTCADKVVSFKAVSFRQCTPTSSPLAETLVDLPTQTHFPLPSRCGEEGKDTLVQPPLRFLDVPVMTDAPPQHCNQLNFRDPSCRLRDGRGSSRWSGSRQEAGPGVLMDEV